MRARCARLQERCALQRHAEGDQAREVCCAIGAVSFPAAAQATHRRPVTCAAVSPRKAPSAIKTNPPRTQKPVANANAPAPPKTQAQSWRGPASVCWMAAFVIALVAMTWAAFGSEDATSFASAAGAQSALHANTTGDLDVVACHPGIHFDPISVMADHQGLPVLSAGDDLLHGEAVCGKLGVGSDAGFPMTKAVHANMLRLSTPGLGGFRLSDQHHNATECMPCTPKSHKLRGSLRKATSASMRRQRVPHPLLVTLLAGSAHPSRNMWPHTYRTTHT